MRGLAPIVDVDANGITADGDDTTLRASRGKVRAGLLANEPVRARYPDGTIRHGCIVRVAPRGLAHLARELGVPRH